jgi:hypothetical protein
MSSGWKFSDSISAKSLKTKLILGMGGTVS